MAFHGNVWPFACIVTGDEVYENIIELSMPFFSSFAHVLQVRRVVISLHHS